MYKVVPASVMFFSDRQRRARPWCYLLLLILAFSCKHHTKGEQENSATLFHLLAPGQTHVTFSNDLTEGLNTNVLRYEYFYNGGGVAVGDFNGDGKQDLYFTGNMVDNKLYLNNGGLTFKEITLTAGVAGRPGPWKTGVTTVDVNGDGKLDIYLCYSGNIKDGTKRINQLFINQGNDAEGIPHFKDMAAAYGIDFPSHTTQAYFFDFDRDGDLDLLLVNHNPQRLSYLDDIYIKQVLKEPDIESGIRLLRNNGNHFKDVTGASGILNSTFSYGLAAGISDLNGDGWPDIYISNDYNVPDRLYINNGNGTFTDKLQQQIGHTSFYSMGDDIADFNNDGFPDICTLDMLPEDNKRQKLQFGSDNYEAFNLNLYSGLYYQYMRNMLHINNGNNSFSEIGQLAGIAATDWSWAPLFADFDNDGWKDLFVSNGYTRDYTNMDFLKYIGDNLRDRRVERQELLNIVRQMPSSQMKSYFFRNNGNTSFTNVSAAWGINLPANSNGAAYADLDNDGDLDLVVNNVNQPAFIYENVATNKNKHHYLEVSLKGGDKNSLGIGTKVVLYNKGKQQFIEQMPTRGYQSSVSPVLHFGLADYKEADSLRIIWPRGNTQISYHVKADQYITLNESNTSLKYQSPKNVRPLFTQVNSAISFAGSPNTTNDFKRQPLLVNPFSFSGPCLVKGDVNADGLEDVYVGGIDGKPGALFIQQKNGSFTLKPNPAFEADKASTDASAIFFDANGDGKTDLYVASGGYDDYLPDDPKLQDRLYLNNGKGNFERAKNALPKMRVSKGCVRSADINGDGFADLFVGGKVIPGRYPEVPDSYILINDGKGNFIDKTADYNSALKKIGMVTDAAWYDMNGDKKPDLIIAGEWMPITVFENLNGKLVDATSKYFYKRYSGWWNCINISDVNHDGHPDIIAGNLGLNSQCRANDTEPTEMYYKDFDGNGSVDPILCFYIQHKSYPYVTRDELLDQISSMRSRFPNYGSYSNTTINQVFTTDEMKGVKHLSANCLSTTCFISDKNGRLHNNPLPLQAQYSPVFAIQALDYDNDGNSDLLLCGNINNTRLRFGKYDANNGILLKGNGRGAYNYVPQLASGLKLHGDVRGIIPINNKIYFSINQVGVQAYQLNK